MKALSLFSGGLDSALAVKIIQNQGIEVEGVYVNIGFEANKEKIKDLQKLADNLGIKLTVIDAVNEYIEKILFTPQYGYGKNMNPCIDCHAFFIKKALEYMDKAGAKFIISGEVVGQRPMSQRLPALNAVNKLANANGLVLRPLSAKLLPPTIPELKGWVDREKLYAIRGRDRKMQLQLAKEFNLEGFESPSGGCLLTDINFAKRLKDYHETLPLTPNEIDLLKVGRHFNVEGVKIIISRNKDENPYFKEYKGEIFEIMRTNGFPGPLGAISKNADKNIKQIAADMMVSYTKFDEGEIIIADEIYKGKKRDKKEWAKYLV
ncbi:argininosuccinate synthase domain-containing protein [Caminibacter pacificus]|uniref:ATP-binding protein n=1 Tax=Caminibacter pacificus TaxID=1424653 RepID=A0AAJ4RE96_9BACT|nr:argininosuccinate synthase domain-containing protein [Caminibacter pacificus]QCI28243.1 ATP-binding protein [Caminibacter pacificus]ROR41043.1 tRNA-specific 2-thiouridylase [Caminibacter pacificus]